MLKQRELHVGEHERVVGLRDEDRVGELDGVDRACVDDVRFGAIGSTPTRVDAIFVNDKPGTTSKAPPPSCTSATVRSATAGFPGTADTTWSPAAAARSCRPGDVRRFEVGGRRRRRRTT